MKPRPLASAVVLAEPDPPADDFKLIHGIGPGLDTRLHAAGIRTYAQMGEMSAEKIVSALGNVIGLTPQRIIDQDWTGQARRLAPLTQPAAQNPDATDLRQHYATFTLELLLDDRNGVRRTRAVFIQAEKEDAWAGWDEKRLAAFITQQAGLQTPAPEEDNPSANTEIPKKPQPPKISGNPRLKPARISGHGHILGKDEPFEITLPIDLEDVKLPGYSEVDFNLNLKAKELKAGADLQLGEAKGTFARAQENEVTLKCPGLKEGVYRIRVDLALKPPLMEAGSNVQQTTNLDGGLLQIY
jgi:hypothetical protein